MHEQLDGIREWFESKHEDYVRKINSARESYKTLVDVLKHDGFEVEGNNFKVSEWGDCSRKISPLEGSYSLLVTHNNKNAISLIGKVRKLAKRAGFDTGIKYISSDNGISLGIALARPAKSLAVAKNIYDTVQLKNLQSLGDDSREFYEPIANKDIEFLGIYGQNEGNCNFTMYLLKSEEFNRKKKERWMLFTNGDLLYP